jgi:hypothetical protein
MSSFHEHICCPWPKEAFVWGLSSAKGASGTVRNPG